MTMLRPFVRFIGIVIAGLSLSIVGARGDVIAWTPSTTQAGAVRARLKIDSTQLDIDLRVIRPSAIQRGRTLVIETGKGEALSPLANLRSMTIATIDLSRLPEAWRGQALRHLIAKLQTESAAAQVLAHGDALSSPMLIVNATLFDGLLIENVAPPSSLKAPRIIALVGADGLAKLSQAINAREAEPVNQRRFYLTNTPLAPPARDPSCKTTNDPASADPARRSLLVALDAWTRGEKPPASRFPGVADLVPARMLKSPKIPDFPLSPGDDRLALRIDVDGNQTTGLLMPDQALPVATHLNLDALRAASGMPCAGAGTLPFAATRASREANRDPRLSLVERYGSRAYYVATLRVVADRLVRERLLLPQDADAYVAAGKAAPF